MRKPDRSQFSGTSCCAIYTRKSSDEGLEQEFNSLDAQREACEAYIVSQRHAGWIGLPHMYDDGGLSGGTMERPALQRLLEEVKAGNVQIIVVYKVDRLTRSLADFAKIVDILDAHGASFVSVTQQFNTTTSMGRLTLNMLLSFAQFEREIASERIRDKIAASKAKGMWMGGNVPLGYDVMDRKLVINAAEAETVRLIFRRYAELGSVALLRTELNRLGVVSKLRDGASGDLAGGKTFSRGALYLMLQNHLYRGEVAHKGNVYPGQHDAIIDPELWRIVQEKLAAARRDRIFSIGAEEPSLLTKLIFDDKGQTLSPTHAVKKGKRYRYYVSTALITGHRDERPMGRRLPAGDIEALTLDRLRGFFASTKEVGEAIASLNLDGQTQQKLLERSTGLARRWGSLSSLEFRELVHGVVQRVEVGEAHISLQLKRMAIVSQLLPEVANKSSDPTPAVDALILSIAANLRRAGKGVRLVIGDTTPQTPDGGLVALIARAVATREMFFASDDDSVEAMAARLGVRRDYLAVHLRLSYLAPQIVRSILHGAHPCELTPTRLVALSRSLPYDWNEQRRLLGFEPA